MSEKNSIDMTTGALAPKIIRFSIPIILSGILQLLYNAADVAVVGHFSGKEALAAVGSTSSLINLFVNMFIGISAGACVVMASNVGRGDAKRCENTVHTAITFSVISGVCVGTLGFVLAPIMLRAMNTPNDVIALASLYLKIYFVGTPANLIYNFGSSLLRSVGDTKRPMIILMLSGLVNVIFNLVFVIIFNMSVAGVALATIISQILSAVLVMICLTKRDDVCKFYFNKAKISLKELSLMLKVGVPAGLQSCIFSISNIQVQSAVNSFGSAAIAGNSAAANLEGFIYMSMNSIYQAALTFTSQNYGAGKVKRIKNILFDCLAIVFSIGLIFSIVMIVFAPLLLMLYSKNEEIISYGIMRISYICPLYFLCGIMEVLTGVLRGFGCSVAPMLVSILGVCGFRMVWVWILFPMHSTLPCLYVSYPVSWFVTSVIHAICLAIIYNKVKKTERLI